MNALTQELVELLSLEKLEENIFRGQSRNLVGKRVFGGQVLGQALRAASYTTDRPAHSLHAYFLFGGDIDAPIIYEVERLRDGKSFASRQVRAIQHGRVIFMAMVSFAGQEEGLDYQISEPEYPAVDSLKNEAELKKMADQYKMEIEKIKGMISEKEQKQIRDDLAVQKAADFVVENSKEAAKKASKDSEDEEEKDVKSKKASKKED